MILFGTNSNLSSFRCNVFETASSSEISAVASPSCIEVVHCNDRQLDSTAIRARSDFRTPVSNARAQVFTPSAALSSHPSC